MVIISTNAIGTNFLKFKHITVCDELNIQLPCDLDMSIFHDMFLKLTSNGPLDCKLCMPRVGTGPKV